ncbi:MAG TPA: DUF899 domain-containing protein [Alphaproteobacteria bacterium]|nr:DUF899 domain-containing protein [Alphaproteobacteria bacterium]
MNDADLSTTPHRVVGREAWLAARKALLAREKEFTRLRDELSAARRALPWVRVERSYLFDGPNGEESLSDLFEGRSQLLVYHFMFDPDWPEGCKSCSFWADNFQGAIAHLNQRDVTMIAISRAPLAKIEAFRKRMGWNFKWVSSFGNDFNRDFGVSFTAEDRARGVPLYNFGTQMFGGPEAPGMSAFREDGNAIFHTYSCYARGLDALNGAYQLLDLTSKGRDEAGLPYAMAWVRHRDKYE